MKLGGQAPVRPAAKLKLIRNICSSQGQAADEECHNEPSFGDYCFPTKSPDSFAIPFYFWGTQLLLSHLGFMTQSLVNPHFA